MLSTKTPVDLGIAIDTSLIRICYLLFLIFILVACTDTNSQNTQAISFQDYYKNEFHKNKDIWKADSLQFNNNAKDALLLYYQLSESDLLTHIEKKYVTNQYNILSIIEHMYHQLPSLNDSLLPSNYIIELQDYIHNDKRKLVNYINLDSLINIVKTNNGINSHLFSIASNQKLKDFQTTNYNYDSIFVKIAELNNNYLTYKNTTLDFYDFKLLEHDSNFKYVKNRHCINSGYALIDSLKYDFPSNSFQLANGYLKLGQVYLYINNTTLGIQNLNTAFEYARTIRNHSKKQLILLKLSIIDVFFELNKQGYYKELIQSIENIGIDYHDINRVKFYNSTASNRPLKLSLYDSITEKMKSNLYASDEEVRIPQFKKSITERELGLYNESLSTLYESLALKYRDNNNEYDYNNLMSCKAAIVDEFYFAYLIEYAYTYLERYQEKNHDLDFDKLLFIVPKIDSLLSIQIPTIHEQDLLELFRNKDHATELFLDYYFTLNNEVLDSKEMFFKHSINARFSIYNSYKKIYSKAPSALLTKFLELENKIITIIPTIDTYGSIEKLLIEKENLIKEIDVVLGLDFVKTNTFSITELQNLLHKNQKVVVYNRYKENVYIQEITNEEHNIYKSSIPEDIVTKFHFSCINKIFNKATHKNLSSIVYDALIKPWDNNKEIKEVIIVPDKSLYKIPFAAIRIDVNDFLIDRYVIQIRNNLDFDLNKTYKMSLNIDAFSFSSVKDLKQDNTAFEELPGAINEVNTISKSNKNSNCFYGIHSNVDRFKKSISSNSQIHLSTHGMSSPEFGFKNFLLFKNNQNGIDTLFGHELLMLDNNSDIVTLSSCFSGHGPVFTSEGVYSLVRQFLISGSKAVLSNSWETDDTASQEIFRAIYSKYNYEPLDKALYKAKINLKNHPRFNAPYYWAGFRISYN